MAINVRLKDAGGNVLHPETDWSVVLNKPTYFPTSWKELTFDENYCVFGLYTKYEDTEGEEGDYNPAIRTVERRPNGDSHIYKYKYYYFTGTSWQSFTDASLFHVGITF